MCHKDQCKPIEHFLVDDHFVFRHFILYIYIYIYQYFFFCPRLATAVAVNVLFLICGMSVK